MGRQFPIRVAVALLLVATYASAEFALGVRVHLPLGKTMGLRPGIAYSRALDKPLAASTPNYPMLQIDVPFTF